MIVLSACTVTGGNKVSAFDGINSQSDASLAIPIGMTMAQVKAKIGPPAAATTAGDLTVWAYNTVTDTFSAKSILWGALGQDRFNSKGLGVHFSADGRVTSVTYQAVNQI